MQARAALERWLNRVWCEEDPSAIRELLAPDAVVHGLEEMPLYGGSEFEMFHTMLLSQVTDISFEFEHVLEDGEWISALMRVRARHRETGRRVDSRGYVMSRFVRGKLVQGQNLMDFIDIFEQLGNLPERTLDACLMGVKFERVKTDV